MADNPGPSRNTGAVEKVKVKTKPPHQIPLEPKSDTDFIAHADFLAAKLITTLSDLSTLHLPDLKKHMAKLKSLKKALAAQIGDSESVEISPQLAAEISAEIAEVQKAVTEIRNIHLKKVGPTKDRLATKMNKYLVPDLADTLDTMGIDPEGAMRPPAEKATAFNQAIHEHFLREGLFGVAESFKAELGPAPILLPKLRATESQRITVEEIMRRVYAVLESFEKGDMTPVLEFMAEYKDRYKAIGSSLPFLTVKLAFMQLVKGGKGVEAIDFARQHFQPYLQGEELKEVQNIIGTLVVTPGIHYEKLEEKYRSYFDDSLLQKGLGMFVGETLFALGTSREAPMATVCNAGAEALAAVTKNYQFTQMMRGNWRRLQEEARANNNAEIMAWGPSLCEEPAFHSQFVCPVTREQVRRDETLGDVLGIMYPCGHVISKEACQEILRRSPVDWDRGMYKCPICHSEFQLEILLHDRVRVYPKGIRAVYF